MKQKSTLRNSPVSKKPKTEMKKLKAMTDALIDYSDIPEITPAMFAQGVVRRGLKPPVKKELSKRRVGATPAPGWMLTDQEIRQHIRSQHLSQTLRDQLARI